MKKPPVNLSRRRLLQAGLGAGALLPGLRLYGADEPRPGPKRFLLYIHLGSSCGIASGLVQPRQTGRWPDGFFTFGSAGQAANPLLNQHVQEGGMIFHNYNQFMRDIADDMCLVNGTPVSLAHGDARNLQSTGHTAPGFGTPWEQAVAQFMRTPELNNPIAISALAKSMSVPDVTTMQAGSIAEFSEITRDTRAIPVRHMTPIWQVLKERFAAKVPGSTKIDDGFSEAATFQIDTLTQGLAALNDADETVRTLTAALADGNVESLVQSSADAAAIADNADNGFRNRLILAGVLAKHGIASGMSVIEGGQDAHGGGADVVTARYAGGRWALLNLFWKWARQEGLTKDLLVVVGHEFGRSPYNNSRRDVSIVDASGNNRSIACPGRDHGLSMGYTFFHPSVPSAGRVGSIDRNLVARATTDAAGTILADTPAWTSEKIIGSMLMRVFPELFPSERMVRKHWPSFREIPPLLT